MDEKSLQLIKLVNKNPCLYDPKDRSFKDRVKKSEIWKEISVYLKISSIEARTNWGRLRRKYITRRSNALPSDAEFDKTLSFLEGCFALEETNNRSVMTPQLAPSSASSSSTVAFAPVTSTNNSNHEIPATTPNDGPSSSTASSANISSSTSQVDTRLGLLLEELAQEARRFPIDKKLDITQKVSAIIKEDAGGTGGIAETANMPAQVINQSEVSILSQVTVNQMAPAREEFEECVMNFEPLMDSDKIIQVISKTIKQDCDRIAEIITSKTEDSLVRTAAAMKSDFDVKLDAAMRVLGHTEPLMDSDKIIQVISKTIKQECDRIAEIITSKTEDSLARTAAALKSDFDVKLDAAMRVQDQFINRMRKMIGPNGDCIFNRKIMSKCSWSGGSKSGEPKFTIKDCKNILDVFIKIFLTVNPTFSKQLMEHFFKQILRNSKSRSLSKGLRKSTMHRRIKKKATKSIPDADESILTQDLIVEALDRDADGSDHQNDEDDNANEEYDFDEQDKENHEDNEADDGSSTGSTDIR